MGIAPINPVTRLPNGFRAMTHDEGAALGYDAPILLYDRDARATMRGRVCTVARERGWFEVRLIHGGAVIRLELVDEDGRPTYAEDEEGNVAAMIDMDGEGLLSRLSAQVDRIANTVQGMPTREDYDALVLENVHLRDQLRSLTLRVERMESAGRMAA